MNPLDLCLWLYPLKEWELIEQKLAALSDFDLQSRRTKQMMRGYANDCQLDSQGRILIRLYCWMKLYKDWMCVRTEFMRIVPSVVAVIARQYWADWVTRADCLFL